MTIYLPERQHAIARHSAFVHILPNNDPIPPQHPAFIDVLTDKLVTRRQLKSDALRLAFGLRHLSKFIIGGQDVKRGDILLTFSPNSLLYIPTMLATLAAGVVMAASGAAQTAPELAYQIKLTNPQFYIIHPALLPTFLAATALLKLDPANLKRQTVLAISDKRDLPRDVAAQGWTTTSDLIAHQNEWVPESFDGDHAREVTLLGSGPNISRD